jgi:hypothetical protein
MTAGRGQQRAPEDARSERPGTVDASGRASVARTRSGGETDLDDRERVHLRVYRYDPELVGGAPELHDGRHTTDSARSPITTGVPSVATVPALQVGWMDTRPRSAIAVAHGMFATAMRGTGFEPDETSLRSVSRVQIRSCSLAHFVRSVRGTGFEPEQDGRSRRVRDSDARDRI